MDLSDLPEELVEAIAEYLNIDSILACSNVNILWRNAFNIDRIWRRFNRLHPKYFDNCVNKLAFVPDDSVNHACKTKELFFKESHVKQNLLNGNFHIAKVECGSLYCDNVLHVTDYMGNQWLFISCVDGYPLECKHILQVFNINDDPVMHASINSPIKMQSFKMLDTVIKFERNKLFFIYNTSILIYEFAYPSYEMKFLNLLSLEPGPQHVKDLTIVHVSNFILQFYLGGENINSVMQTNCNVFNEEGLLVLKNKHCGIIEDEQSVSNLNVKSNGSDLVVVIYLSFNMQIRRLHTVRIFNVLKLDYLELYKKFTSIFSFDICGDVVSFLCITKKRPNLKTLFFYFIEKGTVSFKTSFSVPVDSECYQLVPGAKEVIISKQRTILVFDIALGVQVNKLELDGKSVIPTILSDNLILIEYFCKRLSKHEVWNFKCGQKLYDLTIEQCYNFIFLKNYYNPPKIIGFENPYHAYPHAIESSPIVIISFW